MWIGIDDTDGADGGCTTHVLVAVIRAAAAEGFDLIGRPRLVRLDPNVPWKTRGNGALSARFGRGVGPSAVVGRWGRRPIRSFPRGRRLSRAAELRLFELARSVVARRSSRSDRTDPALVASTAPLDPGLYRRAVASLVPVAEARRAVRRARGLVWTRGASRGLVGAASAIAWPARRRTYEVLVYRPAGRRSPRRAIDASSVRRASERWPELFQCVDPRTRRVLIAPHTRCPILFGVRSRTAATLGPARRAIRSEPSEGWMEFESNQGTGDHLVPRRAGAWGAYEAGRLAGRVASPPTTGPGGHVRFVVEGPDGGLVDCLAFEPTKTLPRIATMLRPGDHVEIAGGRGRAPSVRLERIRVVRLAPRPRPIAPPRCPDCRRTASSRGRGRGYRCPVCRRRFPPESGVPRPGPALPGLGWHDPTPSARRHLHPVVSGPVPGGAAVACGLPRPIGPK